MVPSAHRVTLYSASVQPGGAWNAGSWVVNLDLNPNLKYVMAVESFIMQGVPTAPFVVSTPSIPSNNSYDGAAKGEQCNLVVASGPIVLPVTSSTCGHRMPRGFRSQKLALRIYGPDGVTPATSVAFGSTVWVMTMLIFPVE